MVEPQASRFWTAALQSGLVDVATLTSCWEAIPAGKREAPEHLDRRLARQAVWQNALTLWQAQQLLAGRTSGFRVDRYLLLDVLGHGGMGRVYLARDTRLTRLVALKILSPDRMSNPRAIARFQREARVGARLQHENLVRIYDLGEVNGRYFLVMEYIEGKTIGAMIATQGAIPPPTAASLTRQVALGLEHARRKGLIHRDVNPHNILVTRDGVAKLADLGLALDVAEEDRVTREGTTVGTFDYVAPEQARHSHLADTRSDIYSLGCSLYHMLAGHVPFPNPSPPEKLFAHQALEPKPLDELIPGIAPGLVNVVRKMMRKLPDERFATPLHVAQALEPYIADQRRPRHDNGQASERTLHLPAQSPGGSPTPSSSPSPSSSSSPSGEVRAVALAGEGLSSSRSASSSASSPVDQTPPASAPAREPLAAVHGSNPASEQPRPSGPSVLTPIDDNPTIENPTQNPPFLDLGSEPSLSEAVSQPVTRAWFEPGKLANKLAKMIGSASSALLESTRISGSKPGPRAWLQKHRVWVLAAFIALIAILVAGFVLWRWLQSDPGAPFAFYCVFEQNQGKVQAIAASRLPWRRALMVLTKLRVMAALALLVPTSMKAQEASPLRPQLITHDELQERLADPKLRLLDARTKAEYDRAHIPGAVWVDAKAAETLAARPGGLIDRASWEAWLAPLGTHANMDVLVYDGKRQLDAARIWWLLRYLGVDRVGLVDGNFPLWQRSGRPVASETTLVPRRPLKIAFRADRHATREEVLAVLKKGTAHIVDARSKAEYAGQEKLSRRVGHIPAACHLEWAELVDNDGRFLRPDELRARLGALGIKPGEAVIAHCHGGGRASVDTFALEHLGVPTRNYYLGWSDWGNTEETPVTTKEYERP